MNRKYFIIANRLKLVTVLATNIAAKIKKDFTQWQSPYIGLGGFEPPTPCPPDIDCYIVRSYVKLLALAICFENK